jgi:hypothetical protein
VVDVQTDPPPRVAEACEHRRLDALPPQRAPEALDLAQRLGVPQRGHHLANAAPGQLLVEGRLAAPGNLLAAVVGQDLLRAAEAVQRRAKDAAVVVEEGDLSGTEGHWRAALAEQPEFAPARLGLGEVYLRQGRIDREFKIGS